MYSFHIITNGNYTKTGNFIGFDLNNNAVFLSNKNNTLKIEYKISEFTPLYCISRLEKVIDRNININNTPFLKSIFFDFDIVNVFNFLTVKSLCDSNSKTDLNLFKINIDTVLKEVNNLYNIRNRNLNQKSGFNKRIEDTNYERPIILLGKECFELIDILDDYLFYYDYNEKIVNYDDAENFNYNPKEMFELEHRKNNLFTLNKMGLYKSIKTILRLNKVQSDNAVIKLITKSELEDEIFSTGFDVEQFCELVNSKLNFQNNDFKYLLEHPLDFAKRLRNKFNQMHVYIIQPQFEYDLFSYNYSKIQFEQLRLELIELIESLNKFGIDNVIVIPSNKTYYNIQEEIYYHFNPPKERDEDYVDRWIELGEEEMNKWDEETNGFWRIENDLD
jgi:hypothetical protein